MKGNLNMKKELIYIYLILIIGVFSNETKANTIPFYKLINDTTISSFDTARKNLNDFISTYEGTYYVNIDIVNGYLIAKAKDGDISKAKMSDIDNAEISPKHQTFVTLNCINNQKCFTQPDGSKFEFLLFLAKNEMDLPKIVELINTFIDAYYRDKTTIDKINSASNTNKTNSESIFSIDKNANNNPQLALKNLNDFLPNYSGSTYNSIEISNGFLIANYKNGNVKKAALNDIGEVTIEKNNLGQMDYVKIGCINREKCFTRKNENEPISFILFTSSKRSDLPIIADLLNNLLSSYKN